MYQFSKDVITIEFSKYLRTVEFSKDLRTTEFSKDLRTNEFSKDLRTTACSVGNSARKKAQTSPTLWWKTWQDGSSAEVGSDKVGGET